MKIKKKIITLTLTTSLLIIAMSGFIIIPTIRRIKDMSDKVNNLKLELEKQYDNRQTLRNEIARYKKIKESSEKFLGIYVKENEKLELITSLENIAEKNDLEQKISISDSEIDKNERNNHTDNGFPSAINIYLKGEYINILKYLSDIRRISYYINIRSAVIKSTEQKKSNLKDGNGVEANISGNFFIIKD